MSMQFEEPVNDETIKKIREAFGDAVAHDRKTFLFDSMPTIRSDKMTEIANSAKQPAVIELHGEGEIKTMADGTQYRVTPKGWVKVAKTE